MNFFQTAFLGFVQGLTEFLPVSSSGHLILTRQILGLESSSMFFDILLHVGSLGAVILVFRRDILALFKPPFKKLLLLTLATIPAAVVGFLLGDAIDEVFASGKWLWITFALTAVLLIVTERISKKRDPKPFGARQAAAMGVMQAFALLPGLSRSGSTIFGGIAAGGEREEVAKFSFLMSVPIIIGSAAVGLIGSDGLALTVGWWETLCGMAAAFVSSLVAIKGMMKIIAKASYKPLAVYLFAVSLLSLTLTLTGA